MNEASGLSLGLDSLAFAGRDGVSRPSYYLTTDANKGPPEPQARPVPSCYERCYRADAPWT